MKHFAFSSQILMIALTFVVTVYGGVSTIEQTCCHFAAAQDAGETRPINDFFSPSPYYVSGEFRGFRLYPGRVPELFDELNLESGDLLTEIDGSSLTEIGTAIELLKTIGSGERVNVKLIRQSESRELQIQAKSFRAQPDENQRAERRSITSILNPVPFYVDGAMVGYRLYPGDAPEQFNELGFRAGDLLVEINGQKLADIGVNYVILEELGSEESIELIFERDGKLISTEIASE